MNRPIALVTGTSRRIGIGAAIARELANTGWDIALSYWRPYDEEMPWRSRPDDVRELQKKLEKAGAAVFILAAAEENRHLGITANVINPGATDTGWMDDETKTWIKDATFLNRLGKPEDCANLVGFLCSEKGGWINGQLLYSNGGVRY